MTAIIALLGGVRASVFAVLSLAASLLAAGQAVQIKQARATIVTMQRDAATAQAKAERDARIVEYQRGIAANDVAKSYEEGKSDAQTAAERHLSELRNDNRRLRAHWQAALATSELSRTAAATTFNDGGADLRRADVAAVRGIVGACQAQVSALQALLRAERGAE